ncbi:MAG: DUF507 family protein [bacterium]|nr:DUF507 family protein [bacterium]
MRLSEPRIAYLATKITELLKKESQLTLLADATSIESVIKETIVFDLKREDELEQEAIKILNQHKDKLNQEGLDYRTLLTKTKLILAKQKGIIL